MRALTITGLWKLDALLLLACGAMATGRISSSFDKLPGYIVQSIMFGVVLLIFWAKESDRSLFRSAAFRVPAALGALLSVGMAIGWATIA